MADTDGVPDERLVYRGLRNRSWAKSGKITWKAYMLRAATTNYPMEEDASVGLSKASAVDELDEHFGWAEVLTWNIHSLLHSLIVRFDEGSDQKAGIYGLPLHSTDPEQIDLAVSMATDLAEISKYLPPD
jgi:hypothetical protein